jgi:hypothetical protein
MKQNSIFKVYQNFLKFLKKNLKILKEKFENFDKTYPYTSLKIQLTFIYFFALIDLIYSILNNIFSLTYVPESISPFLFLIENILQSPFFKLWGSPEKVFLMSYIVLEFLIVRPIVNISKFVKFNILLVFGLLMVQGLIVSVWDLIFHRDVTDMVINWTYDQGAFISTNKDLAVFFFLLTFFIFLFLYIHFYRNALNMKISVVKGLEWLTDSVAFWLRIKTPTMRERWKKKKKNLDEE